MRAGAPASHGNIGWQTFTDAVIRYLSDNCNGIVFLLWGSYARGKRELVDTSQNVSEICYQCGFNNLSNFNRIFKAKRGMSPREFRQIYKKKKVLV